MCDRCDKLLGAANPFRKITYNVFFGRKAAERLVAAKKAEQVEKLEKLGIVLGSYLKQNIGWEDVGGYDDIKEEIEDSIIMPLERKDLAKTYNLKPVKGVLMFGPPGCGKTLLMRALSNQIDFFLLYIKTSDILSKFYGDSEKKVSELFKLARTVAPCIIFFDEIDSIGKKRYENVGGDTITPRLLSLFLYEMDGIASNQDIIVVGSTNAPEALDNALIRPGRLDKIIYIPPPDTHAREEIFKIHLAGRPMAKDIDYKKLAELTERYSGADIANICEDVARSVAKEAVKTGQVREIAMEDLLKGLKRMRTSITFSMLERYDRFKLDYERRSLRALNEDAKETISWEDICGLEEAKRI
jgi:SpoVK/Ycf46/Vps4 family AAA+-type ATPase